MEERMDKPIRYESTQEPLDDEERDLMDSDAWDWEHPIEGVTVHEPSITLRFTRDQYMALWRAADAQGLPTADYVKHVILASIAAPTR
jgi:predicted DNA binding CopG/RHH family protein